MAESILVGLRRKNALFLGCFDVFARLARRWSNNFVASSVSLDERFLACFLPRILPEANG